MIEPRLLLAITEPGARRLASGFGDWDFLRPGLGGLLNPLANLPLFVKSLLLTSGVTSSPYSTSLSRREALLLFWGFFSSKKLSGRKKSVNLKKSICLLISVRGWLDRNLL